MEDFLFIWNKYSEYFLLLEVLFVFWFSNRCKDVFLFSYIYIRSGKNISTMITDIDVNITKVVGSNIATYGAYTCSDGKSYNVIGVQIVQ